MKKILEALRTTNNKEIYKLKFNEFVNIYITKLDIQGERFLLEYATGDCLLSARIATFDELMGEEI